LKLRSHHRNLLKWCNIKLILNVIVQLFVVLMKAIFLFSKQGALLSDCSVSNAAMGSCSEARDQISETQQKRSQQIIPLSAIILKYCSVTRRTADNTTQCLHHNVNKVSNHMKSNRQYVWLRCL